jgi:hypothetical protein
MRRGADEVSAAPPEERIGWPAFVAARGPRPEALGPTPSKRRTAAVSRSGRASRWSRRYLSGRAVISLIALASLVVPGIMAVIAAAVLAF